MFLKAEAHHDKRGKLYVFPIPKKIETIYMVTIENTRGNHYHKLTDEWFVAVSGTIGVTLIDVKKDFQEYFIMEPFDVLFVPRYVQHTFKAKGSTMLCYTNKKWSKGDRYEYKGRRVR